MRQSFQLTNYIRKAAAAHMAMLGIMLLFAFSLTGKVLAQQESSKKAETEQTVADDCDDDLVCSPVVVRSGSKSGPEASGDACPAYTFGVTEAPAKSVSRPPECAVR